MAQNSNKEIESRGPTVDAAVASGLLRLGLERDEVTVIVIDEGSRGLLGIGSREAIVRLVAIPAAPVAPAPPPAPSRPPASSSPAPEAVKQVVSDRPAQKRPPSTPQPVEREESAEQDTPEELNAEQETAIAIVSELLDKMRVNAQVSGYLSEPDDLTGRRVNIIDVSGDDLGVLIGPRGETLDSLQYISRLMVAHKLHRRSNFVIDIEGFRKRREQALTRLAERMADKVRQRGEPIGLEPMSAYERRIIHMTLRDALDVYTESAGEGKQRRVRIIPKN